MKVECIDDGGFEVGGSVSPRDVDDEMNSVVVLTTDDGTTMYGKFNFLISTNLLK